MILLMHLKAKESLLPYSGVHGPQWNNPFRSVVSWPNFPNGSFCWNCLCQACKAKYLIENEIQKLKLNFQNAQKCNERNFDKQKWFDKNKFYNCKCVRYFLLNVERLQDLEEILGDDEIDEETRQGMREEFDEMQSAYPDIFPNNPPPRKYIISILNLLL